MLLRSIAPLAAALSLTAAMPAAAQTTTETKASTDTSMKDGVATTKTKVVHVTKRKTHHARKILGVKIGHKTAVAKTTKETTTSADGGTSTTVKSSHN